MLRTTLGGRPPPRAWQVWPRERARCKGQAPDWCYERPLAVDHHRACRWCGRAADSKPKQCLKASGGPGSEKLAKSSSWSTQARKFFINLRCVRCMRISDYKKRMSVETLGTCRQRRGRFGCGSVPVARGRLDMVLRTLASCRQRGGRFGRGGVPVARGRLQNGAANGPWRSTTTARAVRVRELPRASPNNVKKTPQAPGAPSSPNRAPGAHNERSFSSSLA